MPNETISAMPAAAHADLESASQFAVVTSPSTVNNSVTLSELAISSLLESTQILSDTGSGLTFTNGYALLFNGFVGAHTSGTVTLPASPAQVDAFLFLDNTGNGSPYTATMPDSTTVVVPAGKTVAVAVHYNGSAWKNGTPAGVAADGSTIVNNAGILSIGPGPLTQNLDCANNALIDPLFVGSGGSTGSYWACSSGQFSSSTGAGFHIALDINTLVGKTTSGTVAFDWSNGFVGNDASGNLSVDAQNRLGKAADGTTTTMDWSAGFVGSDSTGVESIECSERYLYDENGVSQLKWNASGFRIANGGFLDGGDVLAISANFRSLFNGDGTSAAVIFAAGCQLFDNSTKKALDTLDRSLYGTDGSTVVLDWSGGAGKLGLYGATPVTQPTDTITTTGIIDAVAKTAIEDLIGLLNASGIINATIA